MKNKIIIVSLITALSLTGSAFAGESHSSYGDHIPEKEDSISDHRGFFSEKPNRDEFVNDSYDFSEEKNLLEDVKDYINERYDKETDKTIKDFLEKKEKNDEHFKEKKKEYNKEFFENAKHFRIDYNKLNRETIDLLKQYRYDPDSIDKETLQAMLENIMEAIISDDANTDDEAMENYFLDESPDYYNGGLTEENDFDVEAELAKRLNEIGVDFSQLDTETIDFLKKYIYEPSNMDVEIRDEMFETIENNDSTPEPAENVSGLDAETVALFEEHGIDYQNLDIETIDIARQYFTDPESVDAETAEKMFESLKGNILLNEWME